MRLLLSYLTNRTQRIKMDSAFNYWTNIVFKQVFRKVLYWVFYFLIFLSMICCFSQQNMNSVILLMTTAFVLVEFREHIH